MKVTDTQQIQQNVQMCHSLIQKAKQRINCKAMNSNDKLNIRIIKGRNSHKGVEQPFFFYRE